MIKPGVHTSLGHAQQKGQFEVGRRRGKRFLFPIQVLQPVAVEPGPPLMDPAAIGISLPLGLVFGHQTPVKRLAPTFQQVVPAAAAIIGLVQEPMLCGLKPSQIDPAVFTDGLQMRLAEVGGSLERQKNQALSDDG